MSLNGPYKNVSNRTSLLGKIAIFVFTGKNHIDFDNQYTLKSIISVRFALSAYVSVVIFRVLGSNQSESSSSDTPNSHGSVCPDVMVKFGGTH